MTPLPSRLRESAKVMRALQGVVTVSDRIAAELTEAADALEAGRGEPVAWRVRGHACDFNTDEPRLWHYYTGSRQPTVGVPYRCDIEPLYAAPAAQVAQEGGGVSASAYLAKVEADPRRAAALQRARDRAAGVKVEGGNDAR